MTNPSERIHIPGKPLGRHVCHDERSRAYPAKGAATLRTVFHPRGVPIFNQGELGSCTGNASVGAMSTAPYNLKGDEHMAVEIYSAATRIDSIRGVYPPNDTGSSGLAVAKALKNEGLLKGYSHAFGINHVLSALMLSPMWVGMAWLTGCDNPDASGLVRYQGQVRGGHEIEALGFEAETGRVWFANSWGPWGAPLPHGLSASAGYFAMTVTDLALALSDHGDATIPEL